MCIRDRYGRAVAYNICEDDFPFSGSGRWERIPRELPTGRPAMLHIFEPVEDGQTRGATQFYSVMERLKTVSYTHLAVYKRQATAEIATVNFFIVRPFFELLLKNDVTAR